MARHKTKINIDYEQLEKLAALGLTDEEIADFIGVCRKTLHTMKKENERFLHTIKMGKLKADSKVISSLYEQATQGNVTAQIYWLKNRRSAEWRDRQDIEHSGTITYKEEPIQKELEKLDTKDLINLASSLIDTGKKKPVKKNPN